MASLLRLTSGHGEWLVTVDGSSVTIDGVEGEFVVTPRADGRWSITRRGQVYAASAAGTPPGIWTGIDGAASEWQAQPASTRVRHSVADDSVRAPMSATVLRVHAREGDEVAEGDLLAVVEAMKMEMPLRAPRAGVIKTVHCQEGELVQSADVLVELE